MKLLPLPLQTTASPSIAPTSTPHKTHLPPHLSMLSLLATTLPSPFLPPTNTHTTPSWYANLPSHLKHFLETAYRAQTPTSNNNKGTGPPPTSAPAVAQMPNIPFITTASAEEYPDEGASKTTGGGSVSTVMSAGVAGGHGGCTGGAVGMEHNRTGGFKQNVEGKAGRSGGLVGSSAVVVLFGVGVAFWAYG